MTNTNVRTNKGYWNKFYKDLTLSVPSQFCAMVAVEIPDNATIIEFGCGNGRDSLYFASQGYKVSAMDLSEEAIAACSKSASNQKFSHSKFQVGSLDKEEDITSIFETARNLAGDEEEIVGYSRFVMHSINDEQEFAFMRHLGNSMLSGEKIYFEFRSFEDAKLQKTYDNHYRRFVKTEKFIEAMISLEFNLDYQITGQGMAKYKTEDPFVSRLIFTKI